MNFQSEHPIRIATGYFDQSSNGKKKGGLCMKTTITLMLQKVSYKYKLSILLAMVFTCLSRLILWGSGREHELFRYFLPFLAGSSIGYISGLFLDSRQKSLGLSRRTNDRLKKKIQDQRVRESWYAAMFNRNPSIFLLINTTTGMVEEANSNACEFYGYSPEKFRKIHISELIVLPTEDIDREIERIVTNEKRKLYSRHKPASGEARDVELLCGSIVINSGSFLFLTVNDINDEKALRGVIPICSHCKQIRDRESEWYPIEAYIQRHSEATFSHGLCPTCARHHYPSLYEHQKN